MNGIITSSPTLYDLDQDGSEDLLIGGSNGELYAWSAAGDLLDGPIGLEPGKVMEVGGLLELRVERHSPT